MLNEKNDHIYTGSYSFCRAIGSAAISEPDSSYLIGISLAAFLAFVMDDFNAAFYFKYLSDSKTFRRS